VIGLDHGSGACRAGIISSPAVGISQALSCTTSGVHEHQHSLGFPLSLAATPSGCILGAEALPQSDLAHQRLSNMLVGNELAFR